MIVMAVLDLLVTATQAQTGRHGSQADRGRSLTIHPMQDHSARPDQAAPARGLHYYGVLGSVNRPGVYVTEDAQLNLAALIAAAGGPTQDAIEMASVIRNGRAGLKFRFSPDSEQRLLPGDVIVVGRRQQAPSDSPPSPVRVAGHNAPPSSTSSGTVVAFVGLIDRRPIISSLPPDAAMLPQIIANLYQPPEVMRSVQVIPADPSRGNAAFDPQSDTLATGDVIVFDPAHIDPHGLARAGEFPPAIPITSSEAPLPETSLTQTAPMNDDAEQPVPPSLSIHPRDSFAAGPDPEASPSPSQRGFPTIAPMVRDGLPAPKFPTDEPVDTTIDGPGLPSAPEEDLSGEIPADPAPASDLTLLPADLSETPAASVSLVESSANGAEKSTIDTKALPAPQRLTPATVEPNLTLTDADAQTEGPSTRVTVQEDPEITSTAVAVTSQDAPDEPRVPLPRDLPIQSYLPSRATTLGISVVLVAMLCVVGALLWSRLDDPSGLLAEEPSTPHERTAATPLTAGNQTLSHLLANKLPLIEEQTNLPERLVFHGEAVGRRRIRIDAGHEHPGPHFTAAPAAETASVGASTGKQEAASAAMSPVRIDKAPPSSRPGVAKNTRHASQAGQTEGLLERILVAMEREKRQ